MYPPVKERVEKELTICLNAIRSRLERELPAQPFFKVREVAQILGVSVKTVRRWIKRGKLHAVKTESSWKIGRKELLDFISERSNWLLP
jgi:excisionase family DNA binding protein